MTSCPSRLNPTPATPSRDSCCSSRCTTSSMAFSPCPLITTSTNSASSVCRGSRDGCHPPRMTGKSAFQSLDAARNLHGFPNHRACDQRDSEANRVANLIENALLVVGRDRGVDQSHVVSRSQERRGDGEQTKRSRGFRARKSRKKQHDLTGGFHGRKDTNRSRGPMSRSNPAGAKKLSTPGTSEPRKKASRGLFV